MLLIRIFFFLLLIRTVQSGSWFMPQLHMAALGAVSSNTPSACNHIPRLSQYQRRVCRTNPSLMVAVADGIRSGVHECQRQFVNYRWNCTSVEKNGVGQIVLKPGSSEAAFVYAITAAGVMHSIARSCGKGDLVDCHCDKRWTNKGLGTDEQGQFHWGGCSDNIPYSSNVARRFVDATERPSRDGRALMNLHNNRAGRKIVRRSPEKRCKCHGVSGSCATRTCWYSLPKFDQIGATLRRKYDHAQQVTLNRQGAGLMASSSGSSFAFSSSAANSHPRRFDQPVRSSFVSARPPPKPERLDPLGLVFFDPSPDYCNRDSVHGYPGTSGRRCNRTSIGPDSCDSMCCGRGFDTVRRLKKYKCGCRFIYCCDVVCEECTEWEDIHTCKAESRFTDY